MMNTEHAPTPWTVLPYHYWLNGPHGPQRGRIHGPNNEPIVDDVNPTFADAAFIVRAVNSHAAMLAALKTVHALRIVWPAKVEAEVTAAIAQAEGEV